jgi:hypothetical protein
LLQACLLLSFKSVGEIEENYGETLRIVDVFDKTRNRYLIADWANLFREVNVKLSS